jgi:hypothetical protein
VRIDEEECITWWYCVPSVVWVFRRAFRCRPCRPGRAPTGTQFADSNTVGSHQARGNRSERIHRKYCGPVHLGGEWVSVAVQVHSACLLSLSSCLHHRYDFCSAVLLSVAVYVSIAIPFPWFTTFPCINIQPMHVTLIATTSTEQTK